MIQTWDDGILNTTHFLMTPTSPPLLMGSSGLIRSMTPKKAWLLNFATNSHWIIGHLLIVSTKSLLIYRVVFDSHRARQGHACEQYLKRAWVSHGGVVSATDAIQRIRGCCIVTPLNTARKWLIIGQKKWVKSTPSDDRTPQYVTDGVHNRYSSWPNAE